MINDTMRMANLPKGKEAELFEKLVMAGFKPVANAIEFGNLGTQLTEQDAKIIGDAIGNGLVSWLQWLKHLDEHKYDNRN